MYLAHYQDPQLAGIGSSLKKAFKKVTNIATAPLRIAGVPLLGVQGTVGRIVDKLTPTALTPITNRVTASLDRATRIAINPVEAPKLIREEIKQLNDARKDPAFMKLVGQALAVVALVYPFLQPIASAMQLATAAAERSAIKKMMAKDEAEIAAAQAEFEKYIAELAELQKQSDAIKAAQIAPPTAPATQVKVSPITTGAVLNPLPASPLPLQTFAPRESAQGIDRVIERQAQAGFFDQLPPWALPAAIGAAALVVVPMLARKRKGS